VKKYRRYLETCESYYVLNKTQITYQGGWEEGAQVPIWLDRDLTIPAVSRCDGRYIVICYQKRDIAAIEMGFVRHAIHTDQAHAYFICPKCQQRRWKLYTKRLDYPAFACRRCLHLAYEIKWTRYGYPAYQKIDEAHARQREYQAYKLGGHALRLHRWQRKRAPQYMHPPLFRDQPRPPRKKAINTYPWSR
jgi:hypothetical protein